MREEGLLEAALARPQQKWAYAASPDLATLAAAYAFGLAKKHGYMDGNKRVAFMAAYVFLGLNGKDLDADIEVPKNLHRVQIEHDLRTLILKLRQHYLRAPGNSKELAPILRKSFSSALTLLRHTVIAFGEEAPASAHDIIARAAALTGSQATAFDALLKLRDTGEFHGEIVPVYSAYLKALEKISSALDKHLPKREWRRVKNAHS